MNNVPLFQHHKCHLHATDMMIFQPAKCYPFQKRQLHATDMMIFQLAKWCPFQCWLHADDVMRFQLAKWCPFQSNGGICQSGSLRGVCLSFWQTHNWHNSLQGHHMSTLNISNHQQPLFVLQIPQANTQTEYHRSSSLALCEGNPPGTGGFPSQRGSGGLFMICPR